jgi:hypothetical protein
VRRLKTVGVVFVVDDLVSWLTGRLADAGYQKVSTRLFGSPQDRALKQAVLVAVQATAAEIAPADKDRAEHLAGRISGAFGKRVPVRLPPGPLTRLEALRAGIAGQLSVLDGADAGLPDVTAGVVADRLIVHLIHEISARSSNGGPLQPLASQLNDDLTHLQGQQIYRQGQRIEHTLTRLADDNQATLTGAAGLGSAALDGGPVRPAGAVQVIETDPRRLGVHAAISVPGVPDENLPEYVRRDADEGAAGVRDRLAAAAQRGGFVLLTGGSSVGKTRCAVEAVKAVLPDWWLVHPAGPAEVAELTRAPALRTVVWLDELQLYLDGEQGLTGGAVRALLDGPHPAVIIATLWPDRYSDYIKVPLPGEADPNARERQVLGLADVIRISPEFSTAEQDRARDAARRDPRLEIALESAGYGLIQTLAAAPQLVAWWEDARTASPYAWAVLTAALDAARLGARAPLSADFLRAAAPGYCSSQQQAQAPGTWLEEALAYATTRLHGAAAALAAAGTGTMGQITGYTAADYLIQHASCHRRSEHLPATSWNALTDHIHNPGDAHRVAGTAHNNRQLHAYAIPLYRRAADAGNRSAAWLLVELLVERGDVAELRARADAGDEPAAYTLAALLTLRGDLDELRARADAGEEHAARQLADLLAERGDLDELRARADAGDQDAARQLADLLAKRGDLDELRARADAGEEHAARQLADLLAKRGDLDELRARADAGNEDAALWLATLLRRSGLNADGSIASA